MNHSVDGFIDGSVAAGNENQICSSVDGTARNLTCVPRTAGGNRIDSNPALVQQLNGSLKRMASPSECSRVRIIDKYCLPVGLDSTLIIVDVRHQVVFCIRTPGRWPQCSRLGTEQNRAWENSFKLSSSLPWCPGDRAASSS